MKHLYAVVFIVFGFTRVIAQTCPLPHTVTLTANPDTYFTGAVSASAGSTSITLGAASSGSAPISSGDLVLVIQMQGAEIDSTNGVQYGSTGVNGSGYLTNASLLGGNMEFAVATNDVPVTGGSLTLKSALTNSYRNSAYNGTDGQYRFQVIRVPLYSDIVLGGTIAAPSWNGTTGGVVVINATASINFNNQLVTAADSGFRGGGGRKLGGGSGAATDYLTLSTNNANGSKAEGIAGTPRYLFYENALVDNGSALEGYPKGSYARGAPGNAGGGATDGTPSNNADNAGGGGGGNAGAGGLGGKGYAASLFSGGVGGAVFAQASASRLVMGGGGGAGDTNDGTGTPANGLASSGASGGGIVIMITNAVYGSGTINVSGGSGNMTVVKDGNGGGGAGGSVLLFAASGLGNITVNASGGNGGTNSGSGGVGGSHGPGGGGGGGYVYAGGALASVNTAGGSPGTTFSGTSNYSATAGSAGSAVQNVTSTQLPTNALSCITLPVTFLSLAASDNAGTISVTWSVTGELDVKDYRVERSTDGANYETVATLPRQAAYYGGENRYTYTELYHGSQTRLYYRIIEEDNTGGKIAASSIVSLAVTASTQPLTVSPNPIRGSATIGFTSNTQTPVSARLVGLSGATVWQRQYEAGGGRRTLALDNIQGLAPGMYILQCSDGSRMEQTEVLVAH
jgi:hypothetical protein